MAKAEITVHVADLPAVRAQLDRAVEKLTDLANHLDTYAGGRHAAVSPALRVIAADLSGPAESAR